MSETLPVTGTMHLIARHAASAVWLARYIERIENLARLLDVTKTFSDDDGNWLTILRINGDAVGFHKRYPDVSQANVARFYLLDADNSSSVQAAIAAAKENARTLRALISTEMWLQINVFHGRIRTLSGGDLTPDRLSAVCAMLKDGAQAHVGISEGTFYRDQCWHFTMIGRYLERADQTTRLLDTRFNALAPRADANDPDIDAGKWHALLRAAGGYHAYRREHPHGYRPAEVAGFLLANTAFPRAVALNLAQIDWHLTQLRLRYHLRGGARALERVDNLCGILTHEGVADLVARGLSPFLDWMQREIGALHGDVIDGLCGG
ncbi:MAG TPA: alpha-E domain-containing protein [Acetobacteraceae bacterium]|nr:alpha-E domain-containing protein [Acetobacteraceae bacterium]